MDILGLFPQEGQFIIGEDKYRKTAVLLPLFCMSGEWHILFQKRSQGIRQGGEISLPGGHFEPSKDKQLTDTAVRECVEEMGINEERIQVIGQLGTLISPMGLWVQVVVGMLHITSLEEVDPNPEEVESCFALPLAYFMNQSPEVASVKVQAFPYDWHNGEQQELLPIHQWQLPKMYHEPWGSYKPKVYAYPTQYGTIWGMTGEIVYECCQWIKKQTNRT